MAYKLLVDTFNDSTGIFHVFEMTVGDMARMLTKSHQFLPVCGFDNKIIREVGFFS